MYLFFDTETTGLPRNYKAPVTDLNNWPRMVQIAWLEFDKDHNLISKHNYIVKPEGYRIPLQSSRIHGISTEKAMAEGHDLASVLTTFANALDSVEKVVAHNMTFDEKIVGAEFLRKEIGHSLFEKQLICTKLTTTDYCKIEGYYGYKWPKLEELHLKLFGTTFDNAHDALVDVKACARCYFELKKRGWY